ncbi:LysR family glycine cleavage system transcriptional activator [Paraburkholderia sp. BL6669N2]|uniref:transcriptional regulator GcvA n=1 Tax=Paraburkholderia sp. BL6669N2 TaxID=1938807 RepID=UPI000E273B6C|nr:transcriptional regulator GcvA [Paraburkholderia sp. BL6669N2]REG45498.1 LysR family glycine cleavage system transcriptional activator [Paraburkholderia sp. BL6669N2]
MTSPAYLNALKAFEAAARHQSFAGAAAELNVTAAAVGQQVRSLESWLGISLFDRAASGSSRLILTDAARAALPDIQEGLARLSLGLARLRDETAHAELTVAVSPAFASKWLLPRLEHFRHANPNLNVYLNTNWRTVDFVVERIDIGVRYGAGKWPGLTAVHLMGESLFPVCSPNFPLLVDGKLSIEALSQATLLHDVTAISDFPGWQHWLSEFGYTGIHAENGLRINNSAAVLQAAMDGQGVALARSVMAHDDLAAGRLIKPFGEQRSSLKLGYYIVFRPESDSLSKVQTFRDWLMAEAALQS